jgi:hypothetical protein
MHLAYGGTYWYVQVCTALYRLVFLWCTYWYVLSVYFRMAVHTGTYQYVLNPFQKPIKNVALSAK